MGWVLRESPIDAGVPARGSPRLLSKTLTLLAAVTFLDSPIRKLGTARHEWVEIDGGWARTLSAPAVVQAKRTLPLVCTKDPQIATSLFNAAGFDWAQQAQVALLTAEAEAPPAVNYDFVKRCFNRESLDEILTGASPLLLGLLYPGVDGDFAALVSGYRHFVQAFRQELQRNCDIAEISFALTSESDFKRTAWINSSR